MLRRICAARALNAPTYGASSRISLVSGSRVNPCAASTARNSGSVATAACPIPLIASMLSRIPTEWMPRHAPAAQTRALICR